MSDEEFQAMREDIEHIRTILDRVLAELQSRNLPVDKAFDLAKRTREIREEIRRKR